jgi:hypothetical protein
MVGGGQPRYLPCHRKLLLPYSSVLRLHMLPCAIMAAHLMQGYRILSYNGSVVLSSDDAASGCSGLGLCTLPCH